MAHGVVVVHGIGEQAKGESLAMVVNPLAEFLKQAGGPNFSLNYVVQIDSSPKPAEAVLTFSGTSPSGVAVPDSRWVFREAWWAKSLMPPSYREMLLWTARQFGGQMRAIVRGLRNGIYEGVRDKLVPLPWPLKLYDRVVIFFLGLLLLLGVGPLFLFLLVSWAFSFLPNLLGLGTLSKQLEGLLKGFLVLNVGDTKVYVDHGLWAANVRRVIEEAVLDILKGADFEDVTVICHSWGAIIAYEALSRGSVVEEFLSKNPQPEKKITLVTVGSGLNRSLQMVDKSQSSLARPRLTRRLMPSIFWLNLYSRYDPVPAGPIDSALFAQSGLQKTSIKQSRVVNLDDIINDHGAYWENKDLVAPRLVRAINGGNYPFIETHLNPARILHRLASVAKMASLRLFFIYLALANAVAAWLFRGWGQGMVGFVERVPLLGEGLVKVHQWFKLNQPLGLDLEPLAVWALATLLVAILALTVYKIIRYGIWQDL